MDSRASINYRDWIMLEFQKKVKRNPQYSLRAFARDLQLSPSQLSEILLKKSGLSIQRACKMADIFDWEDGVREYFVCLVQSEHSRSGAQKVTALARLKLWKNPPLLSDSAHRSPIKTTAMLKAIELELLIADQAELNDFLRLIDLFKSKNSKKLWKGSKLKNIFKVKICIEEGI